LKRSPNILWICTDQQRADSLGCYGNPFVQTPNIDALAARGVKFENAFCNSPVCTPSRASFLTGRYPRTNRCRKNGQSLSGDEKLVTKLLAEAGYRCGLAGKFHLSACHPSVSPDRERRIDDGYSEFHWSHHPAADWSGNDYTDSLSAKNATYAPQPLPETRYVLEGPPVELQQASWCAERAMDFIGTAVGGDSPWLYSVNIFAPHHPFDPPGSLLRRYLDRLDEIPLPAFTPGELESKTAHQRRDHAAAYGIPHFYPFPDMSDTDHRYIRAAYWAMADLIDQQVGRILGSLEKSGQRENTLVIFMSDHGELLGDHGIYLKGPHFYEPSVRVPLIISYPGMTAGGSAAGLVELVDLAPSLLEIAGLAVPPSMQGRSLGPLLHQPNREHRSSVFCENNDFDDPGYSMMVRTRSQKLMAYHTGEGELYDLLADPLEVNNLWSDPAAQSLKIEMLDLMVRRLAETADPQPPRLAPW
jgi:arylsulfatase